MDKINFNSLNKKELEDYFTSIGEKTYRSKQLFEHIHKLKVSRLDEVTVFSKKLRERIKDDGYLVWPEIVEIFESRLDSTKKFLLKLEDGQIIETVFMPYEDRNTICISSQVGCKMGCKFCASTKAGFIRNLSSSEIISQIYLVEKYLDTIINNIVYMGIGEPLDNYENVVKSIRLLTDKDGKNISQRGITLSTSGLTEKIRRLANEDLAINLAVSFHYPFDDERSRFMPVNKKHNIAELLDACDYYFDKTGRRVSYEYVLVDGVNDTDKHINKLVDLFKGKNIHINLIPLNEIDEFNYRGSRAGNINYFVEKIRKKGLNATLRNKKGADIEGACGQLRVNYIGERT